MAARNGLCHGGVEITRSFPLDERYGLAAQLRRAAIGAPSNISEGHRQETKACVHYVTLAIGSLAEPETDLEVAKRLGIVSAEATVPVCELPVRLRQVLHGLRRSLLRRGW